MQSSLKQKRLGPEKSQLSMHSQGLQDNEDNNQRFFSFNQSFTNIQHNHKLIKEKTNSLTRIKHLEDQIRSHKTRSNLWEKTKQEIIALNKYLKLSSLSLGCSDAAIMKQFFQLITTTLQQRATHSQEEQFIFHEAKKKENQLFQKLVESNKKKYELQQKLVKHQHQISKLSQINESLRQKSRAQSTQRSSKIKQFHEQTILTMHQKEMEVALLEEQRTALQHQVRSLQSDLVVTKQQLLQKSQECSCQVEVAAELRQELLQLNNALQGVKEANKDFERQLEEANKQRQQTEKEIGIISENLKKLVQQNCTIRTELAKRSEVIAQLRRVIDEAKQVNQECLEQQHNLSRRQLSNSESQIQSLLQIQTQLKAQLKNNPRFTVNSQRLRKRSRQHEMTPHCSQQLLI